MNNGFDLPLEFGAQGNYVAPVTLGDDGVL